MNVALSKPMSLDEFLAWEDCQELRYEFDGFEPQAMAGGTAAHSAIQRNILFPLTARLRWQPCQPHGSELKILVAGRIRYPEAFVACTPIPPRAKIVADPVVVFEVFSDGSANDGLVIKTRNTARPFPFNGMSSCSKPMPGRPSSPAEARTG